MNNRPMTTNQLFAISNKTEREELVALLLQRIAGNQKSIWPTFQFGTLRTWFFPERRSVSAHYIGDHRQSGWRLFEPPTPSRTPHVVAASLLSMTAVLTVSLATASTHPANLFMIPAYGIFLLIALTARQRRLSLAA